MKESILSLLNSVSAIIKRYEEKKAETGTSINLFKIAKIETDEVIICRVLAYLLNPKETHYQNILFLKLFLKEIGENDIAQDEEFSIVTEHPTDKRRRIDLVLKSQYRFIPIEVKVNAKDQENQCVDYYNYSTRFGATRVFFLTPDGHVPNNSSLGNGALKEGETLIPISFRENIISWIEKCNKEIPKDNQPLCELLREFKQTIMKFSHIMEDKNMQEAILNEILKSEDSKKSAEVIADMVAIITNDNAVWELFSKDVQDFFDDVEYGDKNKIGVDNAITITINENIQIDFHFTFNHIFIACDNYELKWRIYNKFLSRFSGCCYPNSEGFAINNIDSYFLGCSRSDKFSVFQNLTKNKAKVLERMQEFISEIKEIAG